MNNDLNQESSEENDKEESDADDLSKMHSLFSQRSKDLPNITDLYKQQQPSRFLQEMKKRKESEDLIKLGIMDNPKPTTERSKFGPADRPKNNLPPLPIASGQLSLERKQTYDFKSADLGKPMDKKEFVSIVEKFKKDKEKDGLNESVMSLRKIVNFEDLEEAVEKAKEPEDDLTKRHAMTPGGTRIIGKKDDTSPRPNKIDREEIMAKGRKYIKTYIMTNIKFFNILSKTYHMDERSLLQRYFYLYQDPSIDFNSVKAAIKEAKNKKDHDVREVIRKLGTLKSQSIAPSSSKTALLCFCFKKNRVKASEPDYSFKEQIDIPMKSEPVDSFVFDPYSFYMMIWNTTLFIQLMVQLTFKPFCVCFASTRYDFVMYYEPLDWFHIIMFADIFVRMNTIYYEKGEPVARSTKIIRKYVRTRLFWELLGCTNFFIIVYYRITQDDADELIGLIDYVQILLIFLWIWKLNDIEKKITDYLQLSEFATYIFKIGKLLMTVVFIAHWVTCVWYLLLKFDAKGEKFYRKDIIYPQDMLNQYVAAYYWTITVMATVGYGDITPSSTLQRVISIILILFSTCVFAYVVNTIGNIYEERNQIDHSKKIKLVELNEYLRKKNVSRDLSVNFYLTPEQGQLLHGVCH